MACTIIVTPPVAECNSVGGISSIKIGSGSSSKFEYSPCSERSTVEEKYSFDRATGIGYYTTTISLDLGGYGIDQVNALKGADNAGAICKPSYIGYLSWTTTQGNTGTFDSTSNTGFAYVSEAVINPGTKMEDGASVKCTIIIKSPTMLTTKTS